MEGSVATGVVGEAMHHQAVAGADEVVHEHKIMLLEGLTAEATLQLLRDRLTHLPQTMLNLAVDRSTSFWVYTLIIALCFYIFHRLTEVRSETNNIWAIASKERKIEAKIAEEEKEEEKQKDKLERHKLRARKQRLLQELHPSIAKMNQEDALKKILDQRARTSNGNGGATTSKGKDVIAEVEAEEDGESAHRVKWADTNASDGSDAGTATSASQKKRAKNRRRRLARRMAMADSGITELGS